MRGTSIFQSPITVVAGLLATLAAGPSAALAANDISQVMGPTPLILKDGRIADVTVNIVPFAIKMAELSDKTAKELAALLHPLATDCFLTAQAIGHVAPGASADGDTLSAHRLARARADRIQAEMIGLGLPSSAIASVWDWQFLVKEPRVTLWIFQLHQGEDCEGKPLDGSAKVAAVEPATPKAQPAPAALAKKAATTEPQIAATKKQAPEARGDKASAKEPAAGAPKPLTQVDEAKSSAAQSVAESDGKAPESLPAPVTVSEIKPLEPPKQPEPVKAPEAPAPVVVERLEAPKAPEIPETRAPTVATAHSPTIEPPKAPAPIAPATATVEKPPMPAANEAPIVAATELPTASTEPPATAALAAADGASSGTRLVFDVNSSYFPKGGASGLRGFLSELPTGPLRIEVTGAVGSGDVQGASDREAARYNRWMAERRVARVVEWLQKNMSGRELDIVESYQENDESRAVSIKAAPTS